MLLFESRICSCNVKLGLNDKNNFLIQKVALGIILFLRLFDPKNANNMFDNLETQAYLAPKNVFKWPIVCQSNEVLNL